MLDQRQKAWIILGVSLADMTSTLNLPEIIKWITFLVEWQEFRGQTLTEMIHDLDEQGLINKVTHLCDMDEESIEICLEIEKT